MNMYIHTSFNNINYIIFHAEGKVTIILAPGIAYSYSKPIVAQSECL